MEPNNNELHENTLVRPGFSRTNRIHVIQYNQHKNNHNLHI